MVNLWLSWFASFFNKSTLRNINLLSTELLPLFCPLILFANIRYTAPTSKTARIFIMVNLAEQVLVIKTFETEERTGITEIGLNPNYDSKG